MIKLYDETQPMRVYLGRDCPYTLILYEDNGDRMQIDPAGVTDVEIVYMANGEAYEYISKKACDSCFDISGLSDGLLRVDLGSVNWTPGRDRRARVIIYTAYWPDGRVAGTFDMEVQAGINPDLVDPFTIAITLADIADVNIDAPADEQVLSYDAQNNVWVNMSLAAAMESDPVFTASPAYQITDEDITNWNTAYSWGDHAGLYDPAGTAADEVTAHETTYDHNAFLTAETDPVVGGVNGIVKADGAGNIEAATSSDITSMVAAASDTEAGKVELATAAETTGGTDTSRAVTPAALAGSDYGKKTLSVQVIAMDEELAAGDGQFAWFVPQELDGWRLISAHAAVNTASTSGSVSFSIYNSTQGVEMLSVDITIDQGEKTSYTAATPPQADPANNLLAAADEIRFDCDSPGTGTTGWQMILTLQKTG